MLRIGKEVFDIFYPVGSYYETSNTNFNPNTNPNWFGEWVEDSKGLTTVGLDTNQLEFNQVGKVIGTKTNKLEPKNYSYNNWLAPDDTASQEVNSMFSPGNWYGICVRLSSNANEPVNNIQPSVVVKRWHRIA